MIVGERELHRAHRAVGDRRARRARSTPCAGSARARAGASPPRRRRPRAPSPRSCRRRAPAWRAASRSRAPNASRDSGRALVTRISSRSSTWSSSTTLAKAVPRAPTWPSTFAPGRASGRPPSAVIAPVRHSVIAVASMIARGTPVRGSSSVSSASSEGRPSLPVVDVVADDLHAATPSGATYARRRLKCPSKAGSGTRCSRGSSTTSPGRPAPCSAASTAARIASGRARAPRRRGRRGSGSRWRSRAALWQRRRSHALTAAPIPPLREQFTQRRSRRRGRSGRAYSSYGKSVSVSQPSAVISRRSS